MTALILSRVGLQIVVGGNHLTALVLYLLFASFTFLPMTAGVQLVYDVLSP